MDLKYIYVHRQQKYYEGMWTSHIDILYCVGLVKRYLRSLLGKSKPNSLEQN